MRVILTRPAHSNERTARKLTALGHEPLLLPLTEPVHDVDAALRALAQSRGALAVTSAEAIRVLEAIGSELAPHLQRPLFAVGRSTADQAAGIGFANTFRSDGDGSELADLIDRQRALLAGLPLTYLAGWPRAEGFETRLQEHGIAVTTVEAYRMRDVNPAEEVLRRLFIERKADAVLLYSSYATTRLFGLLALPEFQASLRSMHLYCLSEQIAAAVPPALRPRAIVAAKPTEECLLGLIGKSAPLQF